MKKTLALSAILSFFFVLHGHTQHPPGGLYAEGVASIYSPGYVDSFLVFKPFDSNGIKKHPLIIFLHGQGESGPGLVKNIASGVNSIPWYCAHDSSMVFTNPVDNQEYSFYVLSPKNYGNFGGSWHTFYVKDMIDWAKANLNVDTTRIYLTGLSLGGGGVWNFITESLEWNNKLAAAAPIAPLQEMDDNNVCSVTAASHLPIWDFHCVHDDNSQTQVGVSQHAKDKTSACIPAFTPAPRYTFYSNGGHTTTWLNAYNMGHPTIAVDSFSYYSGNDVVSGGHFASFTANPNLYEWFLSNTREPSAPPTPPTVDAGSNQSITITSASLSGTAAAVSPGTITTYAWTQQSGPSAASITYPSSISTAVTSLVSGTYVFRLTVTATNGSASDDVQITVTLPPTPPTVDAGSNQSVAATSASLSGTAIPVSPGTITTYAWTQQSGPGTASITSPSSIATTVTSLVPGTYVFRLTVTATNGSASDDVQVIVTAPPTGCKLVWTSTPGSLGNIETAFNLVPCDTLMIKSGTYGSMNISNSRFAGNVYVIASDSGVVFNGGVSISNVKNVVFKNFKFRDITGRALSIQNNTDSCVFQGFDMHNVSDYSVLLNGDGMTYDGTSATRFDDLQFIDDTLRNVSPHSNVFSFNGDPVTKNFTLRGVIVDSTIGDLSNCLMLNASAIDLLIENCKFTNINMGGTSHNCVMYIEGNGIIRNNYAFNVQGDFMRSRPYTIDSSATHPYPDTLWVYNNRMVSSVKYAFAELQHRWFDTTTNNTVPNVRTGVGVYLNNTAGNLRSADYWSGAEHGGGVSMFDVYDWFRKPIFKNNLAFRLDIDSVPDPANPPVAYTFDYMFHNAGGVKPPGESFGDTTNNLYRHIAAQLGIGDTLVMKIADTSIARHAGTNIYSYKFNTDFEGDARGANWDIGADQNTSPFNPGGEGLYSGLDSVTIGGRNCLVKLPTEDPAYGTRTYPLILEIGDQDENLANNPSGLSGLFKSGTPKLVRDHVNIYPNDMNGNPIYYIMVKIQPLNYGDAVYPNELNPVVNGVLAGYPIDLVTDGNGLYKHIMLVGTERGADAWFNCANWSAANGFGTNPPTWIYKIRKIVTSRVNFISNNIPTSDAIWSTYLGRSLRYFEPTNWNTLPDSTMARVARNSNAFQQLFRLNTLDNYAQVYDSLYSVYGPDTLTNIYKLLIDDSSSSGGDYIVRTPAMDIQTSEMQQGLRIYPNPIGNTLLLTSDKEIRYAALYAMTGQRLISRSPVAGSNKRVELNTSSLPAGIYLLQVVDMNGVISTRKVIKQ